MAPMLTKEEVIQSTCSFINILKVWSKLQLCQDHQGDSDVD